MKKLCTILCLLIIFTTASCGFCADIFGAEPSMQKAEYWILHASDADKVIMPEAAIKDFNIAIQKADKTYCRDIFAYPEAISAEHLRSSISAEKRLLKDNYIDGNLPTDEFLETLIEECNLNDIPAETKVRYAFAAQNLNLRTLPTEKQSHRIKKDKFFDRYTMSLIKLWEPLLVLHSSKSGAWCYVMSKNCAGWVKTDGLAFCDKHTLKKYHEMPYLTVTGAKIYPRLGLTGKRLELQLGTRLPIAEKPSSVCGIGHWSSYTVLLPARSKHGKFCEKKLLIPFSADVCKGNLAYTQENLLRTAFKLLGEQYGWGGNFMQWDCSALIHDVYSVFGFELPRNSSAQARIPCFHADCKAMSDDEKEKLLATLYSGALLQMPGHIMLYLGTVRGKPYILHATAALYPIDEMSEIRTNCTVVTSMDIKRANGKKIISCIENICAIY